MNATPSAVQHRDNLPAALVLFLLLAGLTKCVQPYLFPTAQQRSLQALVYAVEHRRPNALELAERYLAMHPAVPSALALAAEAAAQQSENERAIALYKQLPRDGGRWEFLAEFGLARRDEIEGRLADAERRLRRALQLFPDHLEANDRLGRLLQVQGRCWESAPYFYLQVRRGKCHGNELTAMAVAERFFQSEERLERTAQHPTAPDVLMKLPAARRLIFDNRNAEAEQLLREVLAEHPELGEAQGRLGRIIVERGDLAEFLQWRGSLPDDAREHPEVWFTQGLQARRLGQMEGAAACFLEALALSPNHLAANVQVAGCLEQLGHREAASAFSRRGELLAELELALNLLRGDANQKLMFKAVRTLGELGRYLEAAGWALVLTRLEAPGEEPQRQLERWSKLASACPQANDPALLPARLVSRNDFSLPRWPAPGRASPTDETPDSTAGDWKFENDAERLGIRFQYFEGTRDESRLEHIFNVMGGGLAAVDYDLDGWPDLYFAQAHNWRDPAPQPQHADRMYRNLQAEGFADITANAGLGDTSFSHGVTAGDINQDGFPDLYIGNKGPNRLYYNQGDGTFTDVSETAGVAGNEWSTSSVFADFNSDSFPDLYVLNYTRIDETAKKECRRADGKAMACTPDLLTAEPDRCFVNLGDGTFRDVSASSGIQLPEGKGLGVVAWDFDGNGRLGLFVANDTTPDYLFANLGADASGVPRFKEEGVVRGVAFNIEGTAQASMGVAAGDANGDGRIDLFITTFFADTNTLFSQREDRFFDDLTRPFQLRDAGFWMLGFGSQFADFDGDGWQDLIATNGHVDQQSSRGDPDRMPPQLFRNLRGRRFVDVPSAALGPFFEGRYLGRGLATLDWNRDGRTDFGVSHLHAPVALVTNQTPQIGRPLVVRLIGTSGCREPTGAAVRLRSPSGDIVRLQTAGDGFLVTNERRHHFSVMENVPAATLEVTWPNTGIQQYSLVPAGCDVLIVEGRKEVVVLHSFPAANGGLIETSEKSLAIPGRNGVE
jgi:tetratricopeptide (TPR) repeat protein